MSFSHKIKLLYIYKYCNMGGVASVIKQRFCRMNNQVDLHCAFLMDAGTGTSEWLDQGIKAYILGKSFTAPLIDLLESQNFDAITIFDTPEVISILKDNFSGPLIYEVHSPILKNMATGQEVYDAGQRIVVPSGWSKEVMIEEFGCTDDQVIVVPNFVDESLFQYRPRPVLKDKRKQVLWVGKFSAYKNWTNALDVFHELIKLEPDVRIIMMTGGDQSREIQIEYLGKMVEYNLFKNIDMRYHVPYGDMFKLYSEAAQSGGVLLSTALNESFCMVVHEAWRCHLPVVASEVGPLRDTVTDSVNGMKFAVNDVGAAVRKIRQVINEPEFRQQLIEGGLKTASEFDAKIHMPRYIAMLKEEIERHAIHPVR